MTTKGTKATKDTKTTNGGNDGNGLERSLGSPERRSAPNDHSRSPPARRRGKSNLRPDSSGLRLSSGIVARPSPGGVVSGSIWSCRVSRRLEGGYAPVVLRDAWGVAVGIPLARRASNLATRFPVSERATIELLRGFLDVQSPRSIMGHLANDSLFYIPRGAGPRGDCLPHGALATICRSKQSASSSD